MAYYVRVLTTSDRVVPASVLAGELKGPSLTVEGGSDDDWEELLLAHANGRAIAAIERGVVKEGSLAAEELAQFIEELEGLKPASGAQWLGDFFPTVKAIYAYQILSGADLDDGWSGVDAIKAKLWNELGGIFQADDEGFSNEDGYQIVWQFSEGVSGPWWMGLRQGDGWVHFRMELGDRAQREAFLRGEVPSEAKLAG